MRKTLTIVVILLSFFGNHLVTAQQLDPVKLDKSELITPVNADPLSIETVARRRGLMVDTPARNLIVFCTSGFTGASAAFRDAFTNSRRDSIRWQGFQLIFPVWADRQKGTRNNITTTMNQVGKKMGLVSDHDFHLPGLLDGTDASHTVDLSIFSLALSLSDEPEATARLALMRTPGQGSPGATDFQGLERLFTSRSPRVTACLHHTDKLQPGFIELVSAAISRISLAPEGFCALINLSAVARYREQNQFLHMLESMQTRDMILKQLETFVTGRKDTLLLVLDEPEMGHWQTGEDFSAGDYVSTLQKLHELLPKLASSSTETDNLIKERFADIELPLPEARAALSGGETARATQLFEQAINKKFSLSFTKFVNQGSCSGYTVLAQGHNADLFFGISSFPEFFRRLSLAMGLDSGKK